MAADLRGQARSLATLIHQVRMTVHSARGLLFQDDHAKVVCDALDKVRTNLAGIVEQAERELTAGAAELEDALRVLKAVGAEGRVKSQAEPQPATFEGCYVPESDKPAYRQDSARPSTVVMFPGVRRSRPEGGAL